MCWDLRLGYIVYLVKCFGFVKCVELFVDVFCDFVGWFRVLFALVYYLVNSVDYIFSLVYLLVCFVG